MKHFFLVLTFFILGFSYSQNLELNTLTIPDSLRENTNSVVRLYDTEINLESSRKMNIKIKKAVTILNKLGNDDAELVFYYDKSTNIKKIKIYVYNSFGIEEKEIKSKEVKDYSAADGFSLFNDNRLKYYKHTPTSYPYTIYYEYEYESSNTAFIPRWFPINKYYQSLENSTFKITFPENIEIKKSERNFEDHNITSDNAQNSSVYFAKNISALKYEEYSPSIIDITPSLMLASNKFHLEGVDGFANNWNEFGKWMYENLLATRMDLSEETTNKIKELVKGIKDPIKKAKIVYDYVQKKTRYVSIQVGIGGWMPMLASDVDRLSYGDCKGLTIYTKSLMDVAGVESYYTAVYADNPRRDMNKDVISVQGNHVFLYIPSEKEDIWLECTSQDVPFGYQGSFTDDRNVLVVTPLGGEIKRTTSYRDEDSFQKTNASYAVNENGGINAKVKISSGGVQYKNHYYLENEPDRGIQDYYKRKYWSYINNISLDNYKFTNNKDSIVFTELIELSARDYATFSGDRMLFQLNTFNRSTYIPERYRSRKMPFMVSRGYIDEDTFEISIPENYSIEAIPDSVNIDNKFGSYTFSIKKRTEDKLIYKRKLLIKKGSHPKEDYKNFRNFKKAIVKYDNSKIVLVKNKL